MNVELLVREHDYDRRLQIDRLLTPADLPLIISYLTEQGAEWITDEMVIRAKIAALDVVRLPGMSLTEFNNARMRAALVAAFRIPEGIDTEETPDADR